MQIFTGSQIKQWDIYTIEHEPIRSIDLMERAATIMTEFLAEHLSKENPIVVMAGPGNNGGDALALARLLTTRGYAVEAYLFNTNDSLSDDCQEMKRRLENTKHVKSFTEVTSNFTPPTFSTHTVVIDGLFGSGLNKPLMGGFAELVKFINSSNVRVVSIDLPSGLMTENNTHNDKQSIIRAQLTLTLGQKKLSMYLADCAPFLGEIQVLNIGLSKEYLVRCKSTYTLTEEDDIRRMMRRRDEFSHKGTMGHALLIAGSYGMAGAAILAARATLRSGVGKLTIHTPLSNNDILQVAVPEAVIHHDKNEKYFAQTLDTTGFDSVAIGPGLSLHEETAIALRSQLPSIECPVVLDADALNILANHHPWIEQVAKNIILTPHPAEFDRLVGSGSNGCYDRLSKAKNLAKNLHSHILLKGHYSMLCCPDGEVVVNSTGNAGMATAGMGDVLTGIIGALLARGYSNKDACVVGMYVHGLAGDLARDKVGEESLLASDVIDCLPMAFSQLYN